MHHDTPEPFDRSQPALVVTYGFTPHKVWPLTGNLVVLGKGRACDVGLMSPEVAETHCVVFRADGWRLRDCGSRLGTRVNGRTVHEAALCDGDVLQVGNFNFRVHLPATARPAAPAKDRARQESVGGTSQADLDRAMAFLRERQRECEQKAEQLQREERELAQDRAALDEEYAALQARADEAEQALARRQREVEADLRRRWQECKPPAEGGPVDARDAEAARQLELRRRELDEYAAHLRSRQQQLDEQARQAPAAAEVQALRQENERLRRLVTQPAAEVEELRELRVQLAAARRENQEKELQIQRLLAQPQFVDPSPAGMDLESYETELAEFRRQLQEDRKGLNLEIRELRSRTLALEEAARVRELELAQERADLSAERAELDRLRAEAAPPAPPGRLTGTHRLKGTMVGRVAPGSGTVSVKPASNGRIPRVRLPRRGDS